MVVVVCVWLVPVLVRVTDTPGTTAPSSSVTIPVNAPVVEDCANTADVHIEYGRWGGFYNCAFGLEFDHRSGRGAVWFLENGQGRSSCRKDLRVPVQHRSSAPTWKRARRRVNFTSNTVRTWPGLGNSSMTQLTWHEREFRTNVVKVPKVQSWGENSMVGWQRTVYGTAVGPCWR